MPSDVTFSIVIPVFNRARSLVIALDSVLSQDFDRFEVLVVDDGSTDDIERVMRSYADRSVIFLRNEANLGVGPTRNKGVKASHGQWVIFLDSDSYLLPHALSTLSSTIAECTDEIGVVYGRSAQIGTRNPTPRPRHERIIRRSFADFLRAAHIEEALPVTRREVLLRFPFEEGLDIKRECGSLVWYAIGRAGYDFVWTRETIQNYEISPDGLSGRRFLSAHPEEMVKCNRKILQVFGDDLLNINRAKFVTLHQKTGFYCIMAKRRRCALQHARIAWKCDPTNLRTYLLFIMCGVGSRAARFYYSITG